MTPHLTPKLRRLEGRVTQPSKAFSKLVQNHCDLFFAQVRALRSPADMLVDPENGSRDLIQLT